jgi:hypothetical protein
LYSKNNPQRQEKDDGPYREAQADVLLNPAQFGSRERAGNRETRRHQGALILGRTGAFLGKAGFGLAFERMRISNQPVTLKGDSIMKYTFVCAAVLLAGLFLGSGCATSKPSGGQEKAASPSHDVVSPAVAAPTQ